MSYKTFFLLVFLVNTAAFAQSNVVTFEPMDPDPEVTIYNIDSGDVDVVNLKEYLTTPTLLPRREWFREMLF